MDKSAHLETPSKYKVVAMDFGCKHNILRSLEDAGCAVHVVPANATADEIMALQPDGVFLSNGPVIRLQPPLMLARRLPS